jgi:hypothetical protein
MNSETEANSDVFSEKERSLFHQQSSLQNQDEWEAYKKKFRKRSKAMRQVHTDIAIEGWKRRDYFGTTTKFFKGGIRDEN